MPNQIRHPEWRSSLDDTNYPFSPTVSLTNTEGAEIPSTSFLDAHLYPIGGTTGIYLSKFSVSNEEITFHIGDDSSSDIASGSVALVSLPTYVRLVDANNRPAGILVSEPQRLAAFSSFGVGDHEFTQDQTEFVATVCMPAPEIGVRGVILPDGTIMTGQLWFVGEGGVVLRDSTTTIPQACAAAAVTFPTIRVDIVGDPLFVRRFCQPRELFTTPKFVRAIKIVSGEDSWECSPDSNGRLFVQGNDSLAAKTALRIQTAPDGTIDVSVTGTPNYDV
jgi:hypothetical protein